MKYHETYNKIPMIESP